MRPNRRRAQTNDFTVEKIDVTKVLKKANVFASGPMCFLCRMCAAELAHAFYLFRKNLVRAWVEISNVAGGNRQEASLPDLICQKTTSESRNIVIKTKHVVPIAG